MAHIFISYSHADDAYVNRLAGALEQAGFSAWLDDRIDYGTTWTGEVQRRLDSCDAFLLVMTPNSFESRWVNNELSRAMRKNKPIFPLLLEGEEPWLAVESIQFLDVRGGKLPDERFYQQLATVAARRILRPEAIPELKPQKVPEKEPEIKVMTGKEAQPPVEILSTEVAIEGGKERRKEEEKPVLTPRKEAEEKGATTLKVKEEKKERKKTIKAQREGKPPNFRRKVWVVAIACVVVLAGIGGGIWGLREPLGLIQSRGGEETTAAGMESTALFSTRTVRSYTLDSIPIITVDNAGKVAELAKWEEGLGVITQMAVNSMGDTIAVATSRGVYLLDAQTLDTIKFFPYLVDVTAVTFTKDGTTLALGLADREVQVIDLEGKEIRSFETTGSVMSVSFSSYGTILAAGTSDGYIVWSMADGLEISAAPIYGGVSVVLFNWTGDQLVIGTARGELEIRLMPEGSLVQTIAGPSVGIISLAFNVDKNVIAAGCKNGDIYGWFLDGTQAFTLYGTTHMVRSVAFSPDGSVLASGTQDGKIYVWKPLETDEIAETLEGLTGQVLSLSFLPDMSLVSASLDGAVTRWDMESMAPAVKKTDFSMLIMEIIQKPGSDILAQAFLNGEIHLQEIDVGSDPLVLKGLPDTYGIGFGSDDPDALYSVSSAGIWRWDTKATGDPTMVVDGKDFPSGVTSAAFSPTSDVITVGFSDTTIKRYDSRGSELTSWDIGKIENAVLLLEYSPDQSYLGASYEDGVFIAWQEGGGEGEKEIRAVEIVATPMRAMTFTPDNKALVFAPEGGGIFFLSLEEGTLLLDLGILNEQVTVMEFSPDGNLLALGISNRIALMDFQNKRMLRWLEGQGGTVKSLLWLENGRLLVSTSEDGTVRFWGVEP